MSIVRAIQMRALPWATPRDAITLLGMPAEWQTAPVAWAESLWIGDRHLTEILAGRRLDIRGDASLTDDDDRPLIAGRWDWSADCYQPPDQGDSIREIVRGRVESLDMSAYAVAEATRRADGTLAVSHDQMRRYLTGEADMTGGRLDAVLRVLGLRVE